MAKYRVSIYHDSPAMHRAYHATLTYVADNATDAARKAREYLYRGGPYCEKYVHELALRPLAYRVKRVGCADPAEIVRLQNC